MAVPTLVLPFGDSQSSTGAYTLAIPASRQLNDILFLVVETANQDVADPAGWADVTNSPQGTGTAGGTEATRLHVFWKRSDGTETTVAIPDSGDHQFAYVFSVRGAILSGDPWDVTAGDVTAVASTAVSIPGATTTVVDCLVLAFTTHAVDVSGSQFSGYVNSSLTNFSETSDKSNTVGNGGGIGVASGTKASIGTYNATTATCANSTVQAHLSIAIKPEPPPIFETRRVIISFAQMQVPDMS